MKRLILRLLGLLLCLQSCKAQQKIMEDQEFIIPEIDNKFEKFDIQIFDEKRIGKKRKYRKEKIVIEEDIQSYGYIRRMYYDSSFFKYNKMFYKNSFIKQKGLLFNNGSQYGIWYEFDQEGSLIEEIDTDKGYDFGWKEVILYCEAHKILLTKGYVTSGFQTTIYKEENDQGTKIWVITYQIAGDQLLELTLDGKTGEELSRKELEFINP